MSRSVEQEAEVAVSGSIKADPSEESRYRTDFVNRVKKRFNPKEIDYSFSLGNEWMRLRGTTFDDIKQFAIFKINYGVNIIMSSFSIDDLTEGWDALKMDSPADRICWLLSAKVTDLPMEDANYLARAMTWNSYIDTFYEGHDIRPTVASFRAGNLDSALIGSLVFS